MRSTHLLLVLSLGVIAWSGVAPHDREDWLLENALVAVALPLLVLGYRSLRFSNGSYLALFALLCLHEVGAHFTYSMVPYAEWLGQLGFAHTELRVSRNGYDRWVHFAYGVLVMPATLELFARRAPAAGIWRYLFPLTFVMGHSVIYELVEGAAASIFGGNLGQAYLGTQGDPWDAQKDMLMASAGAAVALLAVAVITRYRASLMRKDGRSARPAPVHVPDGQGAPPSRP